MYFRVDSWLYAARGLSADRVLVDSTLQVLKVLLWAAAVVWGGPGWLAVFAGSQLCAGLYLALLVAPNHKGMPVWDDGAERGFLERQVLSSRNVTAHPVWDFLFGGLNYQIEHHLFPTMPRAHFRRARDIVEPFCAAYGLPYAEVSPFTAYRLAIAGLRSQRP